MFKTSESITEISKALLGVQNQFLVIAKAVQGQRNKYATYDQLIAKAKPILTEAGLLLMQPVTSNGSETCITTILIHAKSGEFFQSSSPVVEMSVVLNKSGNPTMSQEQRVGGGISYVKRYNLAAMLAWATGDYDLDQGTFDEQDKKEQFILKSFADLLSESAFTKDNINHIIKEVEKIPSYIGKKSVYKTLKNEIIPEAKKDYEVAREMFDKYIKGVV